MQARKHHAGFTLIEMMITVAIIGILAAIAVPSFAIFQARSRRSESYTNLSAIGRTEDAYYAESGTYVSTSNSWPGNTTQREAWTAASEADFAAIGWRLNYPWPFYAGLWVASMLVFHQWHLIRSRRREDCFRAFRYSHWIGAAVFAGLVAPRFLR